MKKSDYKYDSYLPDKPHTENYLMSSNTTEDGRNALNECTQSNQPVRVCVLACDIAKRVLRYLHLASVPFAFRTPNGRCEIMIRDSDHELFRDMFILCCGELYLRSKRIPYKEFVTMEHKAGPYRVPGFSKENVALLDRACSSCLAEEPYAIAETHGGTFTLFLPASAVANGCGCEAILLALLASNGSGGEKRDYRLYLFESLLAQVVTEIVLPKMDAKHPSWEAGLTYFTTMEDFFNATADVYDDACINQRLAKRENAEHEWQTLPCVPDFFTEEEVARIDRILEQFNVDAVEYQPAFEYAREIVFN